LVPVRLFAVCSIAAFLSSCAFFGPKLGKYPTATVENGPLQGAVVDGVPVFKNIPYAAPPVGELRWRPPQPAESWKKLRDATRYGPHCAQFDSPSLWFELDELSEDCLTLNVWTAVEHRDRRVPVMVWIHGGGYSNGSGNIARLNSPAIAKQGVILVTINYRLSAFGFMTHPALAASNPDDPIGNYGLQDVVAALEWVQRNIAAFGGDPEEVTIFGESAGAGIVNTLLVMPSAEGLFHRAIAQSSAVGLSPMPYPDRTAGFVAPSNAAGEALVERIEFNRDGARPEFDELADELRALSTDDLLEYIEDTDRYVPVVDGSVVPGQVGQLLAEGRVNRVPYINGAVDWEASLGRMIGGGFSPEFTGKMVPKNLKAELYPDLEGEALEDAIFGDLVVLSGSRYVADRMRDAGAQVHSYYLTYLVQARRGKQPGVAHADDIAYVLQTLDTEKDLEFVAERDRRVSRLMSSYWTQFARTGNPNRDGLPEWPEYDRENGPILEIGEKVVVREDFLTDRMKFHIDRGKDLLLRATDN
jgi:para-nitrobenzyl esterase